MTLRMAMQIQKFLNFFVKNIIFLFRQFSRFDSVNYKHQMFHEIARARDQTCAEEHFHSKIEFSDVFFFVQKFNLKIELFFFELDLLTFAACPVKKGLKAKELEEQQL